ncbi:cupin domain-containing protein [Wenyingzhuangia aestuarii]|uniref:cupin domain-containing protein n=1 Tax=Wenyingzhuangia aestuarii TaxID=1647582 RepID=UPI00143C88F5|nr:cupin domain-containing protein [Wenyingzhuangia aestuarii]NJB83734.1 quercetin dioxygenase-like cupin family protein [Wenyingzhuangia aestuarii]
MNNNNLLSIVLGLWMVLNTSAQETPVSKVQHFNFEEMKSETIGKGIQRKWFHGDKGQMTIFNLEKEAHIPWHKHPNEQITYIMSGKVKIKTIVDGKEKIIIVGTGEVIVFPENVPHEFWALEKTVDLDVHVPVRQDWLSKELPEYLKKTEKQD